MNVFYIPNGPKNLKPLFPNLNFAEVAEYFVEVIDTDDEVVATSTLNKMGCCCNEDRIRIHFLNYLGTFDAINFSNKVVVHKTASETYRRGLPDVLAKTSTGIERNNVKANDTKSASNKCYAEETMEWIQEIFDSPKAYEEWTGTQGQPDSYLPIALTDKELVKVKADDRYIYDFSIEYIMANDKIIIRN